MTNISFKQNIQPYETYDINIDIIAEFKNKLYKEQGYEYVWVYNVAIKNNNNFTIQVISRFWQVLHANGYVENISGDGIVGLQPFIEAGHVHNYSSQISLYASSGMMHGHYNMKDDRGNNLKVVVPAFSLDNSLEKISYN